MPAATADVLTAADALLDPARFDDYCVNGLQVPGAEQIQRIATGVSAHAELFELAAAERADLLLVHHGLFWGPGVRAIDDMLARRLRVLFDANIALAAYHLPLDAHPQIGNNALLAHALGAERLEPFALHERQPIGCIASFGGAIAGPGPNTLSRENTDTDGISPVDLIARVAAATGSEPLVFDYGPSTVRRVAIVSGAGADYMPDAAAAGAHALLTGEISERSMAQARELGLHLIAGGHYATETLGIRRLGEHLADRFALEHVFIDVPNPI